MKGNLLLSAFCGGVFGLGMGLMFRSAADGAVCGLLFAAALWVFLGVTERRENARYRELEQAILSPIFFHGRGNFYLGDTVRNGAFWFCDAGIVFALLDSGKPIVEELHAEKIAAFQAEPGMLVIHTRKGDKYFIRTHQAMDAEKALKQQGWIQ